MSSSATRLLRTPNTILGPFYPVGAQAPAEVDLTKGQALGNGQRIVVEGLVVDAHGIAIVGATVEIWHADSTGRYAHPNDRQTPLGLTSFIGHGRQQTDALGRFAFVTIYPAPYALDDGSIRASHIHFQVTGRHERLVTQMFFADERLNEDDPALRRMRRPEALTATWATTPRSDRHDARRAARWTIVMTSG
ncbi:MAG TPA: intradiol ring-cleavage dioxygenase [Caldimonas sp.]|jgi:protocatechuate 3,4-dioxygenase beta subunit|nr:intradiol ring-cleavage dioxygenase [Caldimonas sp.]HEX4236000.1 intradiol ring-cleavage dioxygenase [Caldimonas sp.]